MMIVVFFVGLIVGLAAAITAAAAWNRRTARRAAALERQARSAQRLAELGTLTGGLAHEIKNPLSTVGLNVQLLNEDLAQIAEIAGAGAVGERISRVRRRLGSLQRETGRLREILDDFLRFAGRLELDLEPVDLNGMLDELADFFEPQAREARINLRTQLDADPAAAMADESLLKQAILNLLLNATQAMAGAREKDVPHGGANELMIRTERAEVLGREEIHIHIIDTGPGIASEATEKIFQPYYSNRRGGTGLGLPTTRRIIEEHHGSITVHSEPGRGSDFIIALGAENAAAKKSLATDEHG